MDYIVSAVTDIGLTKHTNQDSFSVRKFRTGNEHLVLAVLCDGMGGLAEGEVASAALVRAFSDWSEKRLPDLFRIGLSDEQIRADWTQIVTEMNKTIQQYGARKGIHLGTTATVLLLTKHRYYLLNVGDTRAYELAETMQILTQDQTVVAYEVAAGRLTEAEAEMDPRRSVLLQCIGASETVRPDFFFGQPKQEAVYMLCSDGFRHQISGDEIWQYLNPQVMQQPDVMKANMETLIELDKQRQERDNITVISIRTLQEKAVM